MNLTQSLLGSWERVATLTLGNCCVFTKRRSRCTTINEFRVFGCRAEELVIAETTVPKQVVNLICSEVAGGVRAIGSVTRADRWRADSTNGEESVQSSR
jgi:hypothetical protein